VVQVEAIDRAPIDDSGIVKTRKCRNRSRPLSNWVVQQRLAAKLCKLVRQRFAQSSATDAPAYTADR